jgi:hypothetical protein
MLYQSIPLCSAGLLLICDILRRRVFSVTPKTVVYAINIFLFYTAVEYEILSPNPNLDMTAMGYLAIAIFITGLPLFLTDDPPGDKFQHPSSRSLATAINVVLVITVPSAAYFSPSVLNLTADDVSSLRAYELMRGAGTDLLSGIFAICAMNFFIAQTLAVYALTFGRASFTKVSLLLLGSLSFPLSVLSVYGRGGMVIWGSLLILLLVFFARFMPSGRRHRVYIVLALVFTPVAIGFLILSVGRFYTADVESFYYEYLGGGPRAFSVLWLLKDSIARYNGALIFYLPMRAAGFGGIREIWIANNDLIVNSFGFAAGGGKFTTYLGALIIDLPHPADLFVVVGFPLVCLTVFRRWTHWTLSRVMFYVWYLSLVLQFAIGFLYGGLLGNILLLGIWLIGICLRPTHSRCVAVAKSVGGLPNCHSL